MLPDAATRPLPLLVEKPLYSDPDAALLMAQTGRDYPGLRMAGDHDGSIFHQHQRFVWVVRPRGSVKVTS